MKKLSASVHAAASFVAALAVCSMAVAGTAFAADDSVASASEASSQASSTSQSSQAAQSSASDVTAQDSQKIDSANPVEAVSQQAASGSAPASGYTVGEELTYTVSQQVPYYGDVVGAPANGKYTAPDGKVDHNDLPYYVVEDTFDQNVSVGSDPVAKVAVGGTVLTPNADYTVSVSGQKVVVQLTAAGLDKIAGSHGTLTTTYDVTVKSVPASGVIGNKAYVFPAPQPAPGGSVETWNPNAAPTASQTSNNVDVKFGRIRITKVSGTDSSKKLAGAQFSVYRANGSSCDGINTSASPITTLTTGSDGQAVSEPLNLSTWYNDGLEKANGGNNDGYLDGSQYAAKHGEITYCVAETKAPNGYQPLAKAFEYRIAEAGDQSDLTYTWTTIKGYPTGYTTHLVLPSTNTVKVKRGKIRILKVNAIDHSKKLAGAEFSVYRATTLGSEGHFTYSCADVGSKPVITKLTTDADGHGVTSAFLNVSNWYNDGLEQDPKGNNDGYLDGAQYAERHGEIIYCLVETKAPEGYQLLAQPIQYELTESGNLPDVTYTYMTIGDEPDNFHEELPKTGGIGVAPVIGAGVVLLGVGAVSSVRARRKQRIA